MRHPATSTRSAALAKLRRLAPWLIAALFAAFLCAVTAHHEMWRDEIQAWLFARDSATPLQMLAAMRHEGHPPLWHLLLWPLAHVTKNPVAMQVLHVALAAGSGLLVFRFSPFSWPVRLLLMAGYFFSYEWAAISRNYAIAAVLVFGICVLYEQRRERPVAIGLLLTLLALTHASGLIIAIAIAATLSLEVAVSFVRRAGAEIRLGRFAAAMALALLGMLAAVRQASPPPDAAFAHPAHLYFHAEDAVKLSGAVIDGYLPVPIDRLTFWNTNRFLGQRAPTLLPARIDERYRIPVAVTLIAFGALLLATRPWMLIPFALATAAQLALTHLYFFGSVRHHGFLFLILVAALWMSFAHAPAEMNTAGGGWSGKTISFVDRHRMKAFAVLLAIHVWATTIAIRIDWTRPFSQGRAAAQWIDRNIPDKDAVVFVGLRSPVASTVVGYLELDRMYYPDRSEFGSYIIYDTRRLHHHADQVGNEVFELMETLHKPAVLVLSRPLEKNAGFGSRALFLTSFERAIQPDEHFWIYAVDPHPGRSGAPNPALGSERREINALAGR